MHGSFRLEALAASRGGCTRSICATSLLFPRLLFLGKCVLREGDDAEKSGHDDARNIIGHWQVGRDVGVGHESESRDGDEEEHFGDEGRLDEMVVEQHKNFHETGEDAKGRDESIWDTACLELGL